MNWQIKNIEPLLNTLESGSRPKGGATKENIGVVSLGAEHLDSNGNLNLENLKYIPEKYYNFLKRGKILKQDILIVKDGATTGKTSLVDDNFPIDKASVNEHVFIVRTKEKYLRPKYAFYWLLSPIGNKQILADFRGAAQGGISRNFVKYINLPIATPMEQRKFN